MKRVMTYQTLCSMAFCLFLGGWVGSLNAANEFSYLSDPTKPPEGFRSAAASTNSTNQPSSGGAAQAADANKDTDGQATKQVLTLIRIDVRTGQGMAVLNGRMVRVGDRIDDARVIAINASGVALETPKGKQKYSLWENTSVADSMTDAASKNGGKDKP